nr:type VI secretion system baseplate subunit TssK [Sansalvadorimonas sp. 2012CJ34-2]
MEGMFITPQHFQQHDRYFHSHVRDWITSCFGDIWGLKKLEIDQEQYRVGRLRIMSVSGVFQDGTPFHSDQELSLQIPAGTVNKKVYLALPLYRPAQVNVARNAPPTVRHTSYAADVIDEASGDNDIVQVEHSRLNLSLHLEGSQLTAYTLLPVIHVRELHSDGSLIIDGSFIPPALDIAVSPVLQEQLSELTALMTQRSRQCCQRLQGGADAESRQMRVLDLFWLQTLNRWLPWFGTVARDAGMSAGAMFRELGMCLGDLLALLSEPLPELPYFDHSNPGPSVSVLFRSLRRVLSSVADDRVVVINWDNTEFANRRLMLLEDPDPERMQSGRIVLGVQSSLGVVATGQRFVNASKLAGKRRIDTLVCSALPGIRMLQLPMAPGELQPKQDVVYFEVNRSDPLWQELISNGDQLVIHIDERLPDVELTLYVIRGGESI